MKLRRFAVGSSPQFSAIDIARQQVLFRWSAELDDYPREMLYGTRRDDESEERLP